MVRPQAAPVSAMTYANYSDLKARKPLRWWHDALIDYMLTHPGAPLKEIALEFKRSISHISVIINTDMFKARFAQRRSELNEQLGASVQRKMLGALDLALDVVTDQLNTKRSQIPFKDTSAFVNSTLERLGYGSPKASTVVNVNAPTQVAISASDLQEARELLRRNEAAKIVEHVAPKLEASSEHTVLLVEETSSDAA